MKIYDKEESANTDLEDLRKFELMASCVNNI